MKLMLILLLVFLPLAHLFRHRLRVHFNLLLEPLTRLPVRLDVCVQYMLNLNHLPIDDLLDVLLCYALFLLISLESKLVSSSVAFGSTQEVLLQVNFELKSLGHFLVMLDYLSKN